MTLIASNTTLKYQRLAVESKLMYPFGYLHPTLVNIYVGNSDVELRYFPPQVILGCHPWRSNRDLGLVQVPRQRWMKVQENSTASPGKLFPIQEESVLRANSADLITGTRTIGPIYQAECLEYMTGVYSSTSQEKLLSRLFSLHLLQIIPARTYVLSCSFLHGNAQHHNKAGRGIR